MSDEPLTDAPEFPVPEPVPVSEPMPEAPLTPHPRPDAWRELGDVLWLSFPIIITMLSYTVMHFVDVRMVADHSHLELAAVSPATSVFFLFTSLMMGTLSITNTFVGQSVGRGRKRDAPGYVWQAVYVAVIWGVAAWCLRPLAGPIFAWAGHPPEIRPFEASYFRYILLRVPAIGFVYSLSAFYQATKRPVVPMIAAMIGASSNIAFNYALIFGRWGMPEMGITGAAIGTVLATYLQAALMFGAFLSRPTHRAYGSRDALAVDVGRMWRLIRFGLPAGLTWCLENASWTLFLMKIIGALGKEALAANGAALQVVRLSFMPVLGLNIGIQALVGQHIGMGDHAGAKRRAYRALALAVGFMVLMGVLFVVFRGPLIQQFIDEDTPPESAARILRMGSTMLIFGALFQAFDAVFIMSYGALKGAGDTRFPMFVTILCSWFIFLPLATLFVFVLDMGVAGAWLAVTVYLAVGGFITFWRFASEAWRKIDIFEGERRADSD
jgi:MATE family multidrug resistance protein